MDSSIDHGRHKAAGAEAVRAAVGGQPGVARQSFAALLPRLLEEVSCLVWMVADNAQWIGDRVGGRRSVVVFAPGRFVARSSFVRYLMEWHFVLVLLMAWKNVLWYKVLSCSELI